MVYQDATELPRYVQTFTSSRIDIWFNLQRSLGASPTTDSSSYQLYYGRANAGTPPGTINDILPAPVDGSTLGAWHFSDGSGGAVTDSSGNGRNGSASNLGWTSGKFGPAGVFNGSNSIVNAGNSTTFNPSALTVEAWIYSTSSCCEQTIVRKSANDGSLIYDFQVDGNSVWLRLNGNSGNVRSSPIERNRWYHIADTYDGSTIRVYVNGVLDGSASYAQALRRGDNTNLYIGGDGQFNNKWFYGQIQNVRVSNTARTSFPYGAFGQTTQEPSAAAGGLVPPPQTGAPSLVVQSATAYPRGDGTYVVVADIRNDGTRATGNEFAVDFYLDRRPSGPGDVSGSVGSSVVSSLAANQSVSVAGAVAPVAPATTNQEDGRSASSVPLDVTHTLYVQADLTGSLSRYTETNKTISAPITLCVASADLYEGDTGPPTARPITVNGSEQTRNIRTPGVGRWGSFAATGGTTYTLATANLGANVDTVLSLLDSDGTSLVASNDDHGDSLASQIVWTAPLDGTYYARVTPWNPSASGCGTSFDLTISAPNASVTPTMVSATATAVPTPVFTTATAVPTPSMTTPTSAARPISTTVSATATAIPTPSPVSGSTFRAGIFLPAVTRNTGGW